MWRLMAVLLAAAVQAIPVVTITSDADAARVLELTAAQVARLRAEGVTSVDPPPQPVPDRFYAFPLPQSQPDNAKARAALRAQGVDERRIGIGEAVGAFVAEGDDYWFGKSFYNAEGETGRGALGVLKKDGTYTLFELPELRQSSVSALAVDPDAVWAGLVHHGERADTGRGLLRYDRNTRRRARYAVPGVIHRIVRIDARVFLGTTEGPYMLGGGALTRLGWK